jgi:type I restriction enzyme S subunit
VSLPVISLGDVAEFIRGVTFKPDELVELGTSGAIVCMRTKNVQEQLDQRDLIAVPPYIVKDAKRMLREGDLLISTANSFELVGKACWVPKLEYTATAGGFISILRADRSKIEPRYLYHWVRMGSTQHALRGCSRKTTNISNMDFSQARDLRITLPPLKEQIRIASILDKADSIRRKRQEAIAMADEFLRSVFLDMFGDPVTNPNRCEVKLLGELIKSTDRLNYGVVQPGDHEESGVPLIRSGDLLEGKIDINNLRRVSNRVDERHKSSRLTGNEILMACVGTIGKVMLADKYMAGWNVARAVARIPLRDEIDRNYVYRYLQSPYMQNYFEKETRTVAQPTLNVGLISKAPILIPPKNLQLKFLEVSKKMEIIKMEYEECRSMSSTAFNSLSQKAFAGEL